MLFLTVVGGNPGLVENGRSPGLKYGMGLFPVIGERQSAANCAHTLKHYPASDKNLEI